MKMIIKLIGYSLVTICLASNTFAMIGGEKDIPKEIPVVIKLKSGYQQLKSDNEKELGNKWANDYMETDSNYKKESGSYSGSSEQYGNTTYESGDTYYQNVTEIIKLYSQDILKETGDKPFAAIRVQAGWHQNEQDDRHITISFIDKELKGVDGIRKLHLDEKGIRK